MKLSEHKPSATTRVLVMGLSGTGKSTLVAKLALTHKLYWFTLDNDADILLKLPPEAQENIELYNIPDSANRPAAADTIMKLLKNRKGSICREHGIWECNVCKKNSAPLDAIDLTTLDPVNDIVVVDTITQLGLSCLALATKNQPVDYKPERDDWGALRKWTEFFKSEFQAARFNLIGICHATEAEMEDSTTGQPKFKLVPAFGSKDMSSKIAGAFSHVVYTDVVNKKHRAYCASTYANNVLTKSRTDFRIEDLPEPSLEPIFAGKVSPTDQSPVQSTNSGGGSPAHNAIEHLKTLSQSSGVKS